MMIRASEPPMKLRLSVESAIFALVKGIGHSQMIGTLLEVSDFGDVKYALRLQQIRRLITPERVLDGGEPCSWVSG
jgi:hypothetical protein